MPTIDSLKEQEAPPTPLFLFDCVLASGSIRSVGHARGDVSAGTLVCGAVAEAQLISAASIVGRGAGWSAEDLGHAGERGFALFANRTRDGISRARRLRSSFCFTIWRRTRRRRRRELFFAESANHGGRDYGIGVPGQLHQPAESATDCVAGGADSSGGVLGCFLLRSAQRAEALNGGAKGKYSALYQCGYSRGSDRRRGESG